MSKIAKKDNKVYYANKLPVEEQANIYYCPNEKCNAKMQLKNIMPTEKHKISIDPYFSAIRGQKHIEDCQYANNSSSGANANPDGFDYKDFCENIMKKKMTIEKVRNKGYDVGLEIDRDNNKLTTVSKLYHYCQHRDRDHIINNNTKIADVFLSEKDFSPPFEIKQYDRGKFSKILELRFNNCSFSDFKKDGYYKLWCKLPHNAPYELKPKHTLWVKDKALWTKICYKLNAEKGETTKNGYVIIAVLGNWDEYHCTIESEKQIAIVGLHT